MAYATIYEIFKEKENTVGLTESEAVNMAKVREKLFELLDNLEMETIEGRASGEVVIQVDYLRNLLLSKTAVR